MESEKVKEIKKIVRYFADKYMTAQCIGVPKRELFADILTLINELESENERLLGVIDIANEREYRKKFNDEWRKEYQKELDKQGNGHIAGYPDFDLVYKLYFEQKDRIAELEKENAKLLDSVETVQSNRCVYKCVLTKEHLTKFAEKLKEKKVLIHIGLEQKEVWVIKLTEEEIDETLKEFINE